MLLAFLVLLESVFYRSLRYCQQIFCSAIKRLDRLASDQKRLFHIVDSL
ncbi:hypothetical protein vBSenS3_216 [Salmonella phage vB_SenS-3]|uniref:Uncharacterized protein n=1 Tax=Salmonella phage PMBT36 TaxID=3229746 RepID=A0AB39C0C2_9CAUD|nr:hypothetical protein vBSenS3_09 [Salmonella phage vB_SenS-3]QIN93544.1 hypothetical protein vBSenS3_216 [Salmonella phage vB_SenS-3]